MDTPSRGAERAYPTLQAAALLATVHPRGFCGVFSERYLFAALAVALFVASLWIRQRRWMHPPTAVFMVGTLCVGGVSLTALLCQLLFWDFAGLTPMPGALALAVSSSAVPATLVAITPLRHRPVVAGIACVLLGTLTLGDLVYFRYFGSVVPLLVFGSAGQVWDTRESIWALVTPGDAWLAAPILLGVGLGALRLEIAEADLSSKTSRLVATIWVCAPLLGCLPAANDLYAYLSHGRSWKVISLLSDLKTRGSLLVHARDLSVSVREQWQHRAIDDEERAKVAELVRAHRDDVAPLEALPTYGAARGANALVVQIEALQSWALDAEVDGAPVMPFLRALRDRSNDLGALFDQTGDSPTSDCEYLVLNSLLPLERGSVAFRRPGNEFVALPQVLREAGYTTLSAHGYTRGMWNRAVLHPRYGFAQSYFLDDLPPEAKLGWGMGDKPFLGHALDLIREAKEPFFAFLITLTSHHPYHYLPAEERSLDTAGLPRAIGDYLASMRYVDEALQQLFAGLEEHQLLENTVVLLYGDHDAKLRWSAKVAAEVAPRVGIEPGLLTRIGRRDWRSDRVPAILVLPSWATSPQRATPPIGGQIDLGPTLLHHLGVRAPTAWLGAPLVTERSGWVFRGDGAGVDAELEVPPGGGPNACRRRDSSVDSVSARTSCARLVEAISAHRRASAAITLHNLAQELASSRFASSPASP